MLPQRAQTAQMHQVGAFSPETQQTAGRLVSLSCVNPCVLFTLCNRNYRNFILFYFPYLIKQNTGIKARSYDTSELHFNDSLAFIKPCFYERDLQRGHRTLLWFLI